MNKWASMAGLVLALATAPAWAQTTKTAATVKPVPANGDTRYVGYYYPKPTSTETYTSQMQSIGGVGRAERIQFVTVVSQGTLQSNYRVPYAVFAKGEKGDHLIIVGRVVAMEHDVEGDPLLYYRGGYRSLGEEIG